MGKLTKKNFILISFFNQKNHSLDAIFKKFICLCVIQKFHVHLQL